MCEDGDGVRVVRGLAYMCETRTLQSVASTHERKTKHRHYTHTQSTNTHTQPPQETQQRKWARKVVIQFAINLQTATIIVLLVDSAAPKGKGFA